MSGYKSIFTNAEQAYNNSTKSLEDFKYNRKVYGFCINEELADDHSLGLSREINAELTEQFMKQPKGLTGFKGHEDKYTPIDDIDGKHILQLTFLFNTKRSYNHIVEIGGGYGNMARLCNNIVQYTQWDIIDIPHMSEIQEFYLKNEIKDVSKFRFLSAYSNVEYSKAPIDLVIATHSLSELAIDDFCNYFNNVIKYSKFIFYGFNVSCPSPALIQTKFNYLLENGFVVENVYQYKERQGADVVYALLKSTTIN
jgi:hypothetical protein